MLYVLIEVEDINNMYVIKDHEDSTLIFSTPEEANDYGERHCLDARVVGIEE